MKRSILAIATASTLIGAFSAPANAVELTGNAGFVTNYLWRGADQSNGKGAAQGGLDFGAGDGAVQFYAGTWLSTVEYEFIDLDDTDSISGMEMDFYAGINGDIGDFSWALGGTFITYTDRVNPDYIEGNIALGYKWISFDSAIGKYDNPGMKQDYIWSALTVEHNGFYGLVGYTEWDKKDEVITGALADGGYGELGYGSTLEWEGKELFDYSISYTYSEVDNLTANQPRNKLVFSIVKNFSIVD